MEGRGTLLFASTDVALAAVRIQNGASVVDEISGTVAEKPSEISNTIAINAQRLFRVLCRLKSFLLASPVNIVVTENPLDDTMHSVKMCW